jgi:hypothetical protein
VADEDRLLVRLTELERDVAEATAAERAARAAEAEAGRALAAAQAALAEAEAAERERNPGSDAAIHEIEFFLLSRLLAQRAMSVTGPSPLVLDDALHRIPEPERVRLLDRLARLSDDVQVVYLSDDPVVLDWAQQLSPELGGLAHPAVRV